MPIRLLVVILVILGLGCVSPAAAQQPSCRFVLGFATLRDLVGASKVGNCLEDEHFNLENGNAEQRTSGGLLVWRKIDNFTAFTDGGTTWVNGPNGLQSRPNAERFSWERDPVQSGAGPSAGATPGADPNGFDGTADSDGPYDTIDRSNAFVARQEELHRLREPGGSTGGAPG